MKKVRLYSKKGSIPEWVGNYPFPASKKKPVKIRKSDVLSFLYGIGSHKVLCTTWISTDRIQLGTMIIPGGKYFEPPDIHAGDEVYYIIKGEATVFNPRTGRAFKIKEGETCLIPKGIWHQAFNFGKKTLEVLAFIAPLQWSKDGEKIPTCFPGKARYYKGNKHNINILRKWPFFSSKIERSEIVSIIPEKIARLIYGKDRHFPISFFVSDEFIHCGEMSIFRGIPSEKEEHRGDEVLYVKNGHLGIRIYRRDSTIQTFKVSRGESFLIPEGTKHQYFNSFNRDVEVIFGVAPEL